MPLSSQFSLLKASAVTAIQADLESAVATDRSVATLAAQAAGASLFASLSDGESATSDNDLFLVQEAPGTSVYKMCAGVAEFVGWLGELLFDNVSDLFNSRLVGFLENQVIRTREEGFSYQVAAEGATDHHLTTAGEVKLRVLPGADGAYNVKSFGAIGDWDNATQTGNDDSAAFQLACDVAGTSSTAAARVVVPMPQEGKEFYLGSAVELGRNGPVEIHGPNPESRIIRKAGDDYAFTSLITDWCGVFGVGILGQGLNDPNDNGATEFYPAIKSAKRIKCDVLVLYCGGDNYPGRSEYRANGNQEFEPVTGKKRSKCSAILLETTFGNGTNYSDIKLRVARCAGDGVYIDVDGEPGTLRNQNGMSIEISSAFQITGYAINCQNGVRNRLVVRTAQGHFSQGVIRSADTQNDCTVFYTEGDVGGGYTAPNIYGRAFLIEGAQNYCRLSYAPGWTYQSGGTVNETFAFINANNACEILAPVAFEYKAGGGKRFEGSAPDFIDGFKLNSGKTLEYYDSGTDDGSVVGMSNGSTGNPLSATWSTQSVKYTRVGNQIAATISMFGTLTANQTASLSITGLGTLLGLSLPDEGLIGYGHIRNVTTGASSKPCLLRRNSTDAAMVLKHSEGVAAQMSNFASSGEVFEARFSLNFSV